MASLKGKKFLIVDDEDDIRQIWLAECEYLDAEVFQAENGEEAFKIFLNENIDVVISDIRMPQCDGIELLKKIKGSHKISSRVFLVTGFADVTESEALGLGAEALIQKPFDLEAVLRGIATTMIG